MPPATEASKAKRDSLFLGERGEPHAVLGEQRLVCGDEGFARGERGFRRRKCGAVLAPDQFDEKIDAGGPCQSHAIVEPWEAGEIDSPLLLPSAGRDASYHDLPAGPAPQRLGLPAEQRYNRGSNGAETGNADAQRRRHGCTAREAGEWETTKSAGSVDRNGFSGLIKGNPGRGDENDRAAKRDRLKRIL